MAELWMIILMATAAAAWFFCGKLTGRQQRSFMIYFWSIVLALGAAGFVIQWIIDGHMPAPCCT